MSANDLLRPDVGSSAGSVLTSHIPRLYTARPARGARMRELDSKRESRALSLVVDRSFKVRS
jgi:hypothetical protein